MKKAGKTLVLRGSIVHTCLSVITLLIMTILLIVGSIYTDYANGIVASIVISTSVVNLLISTPCLVLSIISFKDENPKFGVLLTLLVLSAVTFIFSIMSIVIPFGLVAIIIGAIFLLITSDSNDNITQY